MTQIANEVEYLHSPSDEWFAITPGTSDLSSVVRGIYVGTGGTIVAVSEAGTEIIFANVPTGTILPIRAAKVLATSTAAAGSPNESTTATMLVGLI